MKTGDSALAWSSLLAETHWRLLAWETPDGDAASPPPRRGPGERRRPDGHGGAQGRGAREEAAPAQTPFGGAVHAHGERRLARPPFRQPPRGPHQGGGRAWAAVSPRSSSSATIRAVAAGSSSIDPCPPSTARTSAPRDSRNVTSAPVSRPTASSVVP